MSWPAQIGPWKVGPLLGAGGTAEVRLGLALDGGDGTALEVALKRPARLGDPALDALLRAEAALLARVQHGNIIRCLGLIEDAAPVVVLERLRGRVLGEGAGLALPAVVSVVGQAAAALAALHAARDEEGPLGAVHRDVAPDNLFVTTEGVVKLFDFNVAIWRGHEPPAAGALQGRIAYMAPEQARGEAVDDRADVFSLGVVLWELVAGQRLLWRGNALATLRALTDEPIPDLGAGAPEGLRELAARMLDREPRRRPSAAEVKGALRTTRI